MTISQIKREIIFCSSIALWSLIQCVLHLTWVVYGYFMYTCAYQPDNIFIYFTYLTYFYESSCQEEIANNGTIQMWPRVPVELFCDSAAGLLDVIEGSDELCQFGRKLAAEALMPEFSPHAHDTYIFFLVTAILDCFGIVASVGLFMGVVLMIRETWSVLFYAPWTAVTFILTGMDIFMTWEYGTDLFKTRTITEWLDFLHVPNAASFAPYDSIPWIYPSSGPLIMCLLSCRLGVLVITNIIGATLVIRTAVKAYGRPYNPMPPRRRPKYADSPIPQGEIGRLDPTAARIKSWQLFYGARDSITSHKAKPGPSNPNQPRDVNSNNVRSASKPALDESITYVKNESISTISTVSSWESSFIVTESECPEAPKVAETSENVKRTNEGQSIMDVNHESKGHLSHVHFGLTQRTALEELRGQLPWSYMKPEESIGVPVHSILKVKSNELLELEIVADVGDDNGKKGAGVGKLFALKSESPC